jgi:NDP-sugar pyrophosphorylase family protein
VDPERAKSFGLIGTDRDEKGNQLITKFIEKPKYTDSIPKDATIEEKADWIEVQKAEIDKQYMANPGMYFLSKEAVKVLKDINLEEKGAGFLGKQVIPKIVELCNTGKLLDENGNPMKVYTVPLEAKGGKLAVWDDIGSAEAYVKMIQDVAKETKENEAFPWLNKYYGVPNFVLQDFKNNTEIETGVVKMSKGAGDRLEIFKDKYGVDEMRGNILVL